MSRDMHDATDHNTPDPDPLHAAWLTPVSGWTWDADSLMMGEYVGYPLYLRLRDRLQTLRLPADTHNTVIQELIDMHDVAAIDAGVACSSLVVRTCQAGDHMLWHGVEFHDVTQLAPLSGKVTD